MPRWPVRVVLAVVAASTVAALLAWVVGLGSFRSWFLLVSAPAMIALGAAGAIAAKKHSVLHRMLVAGTLGGLFGTAGYDLFRMPFVVAGLRLFAPIDSYGVLLLGADSSSPLTAFAGWGYHVANGVGFGIAYALVAHGRSWVWAMAWAMVLETVTILTPFADSYALRGKWDLILIAYAAHVAYGLPLGLIVQRAPRWRPARPPASLVLVGVGILLAAWLQPGTTPDDLERGRAVAPGPSAVIVRGHLVPEWLRVAPGTCAIVENTDRVDYELSPPYGSVAAGQRTRLCERRTGAHRVKAGPRPYSGGFLLVDPEA